VTEKKSELVKWSNTFSVGVKIIDDQHKSLLRLVNDMFNHVSGDEALDSTYFREIKQHVIQYIRVHFSTEEKIMIYTYFPGYTEHKKAHDSFIIAVLDSILKFEAGKRLALIELIRFLKEWILTHVAIMDKQYFFYFKRIATRKADGRLSINQTNLLVVPQHKGV
jgi:hemerythrin